MMTLLPLLPVLNQLAVSTERGQSIAVSARVAIATIVVRRHCGDAVARIHTESLPLAS